MNNEELKKKIEGILQEEIEYVVVCGSSVKNVCIEHIADALIAAGFGDVKTAQEICDSATAMAVLEAAKAEHRAEVAEKALKIVCRMQENLNILVDGKPWTKEEIYNRYIQQAEKELAEEGKE